MKVIVIGGSGLIGSKLTRALIERGHDAVAASRGTGVDTMTGAGLAEVLTGAAVVVDVSNSPSFDDDTAMGFFRTSTTNLLTAERHAGVAHHVALSVVGTERLAPQSGYFQAKLAQEELIAAGPIPYSIVRATQFFEFLKTIAAAATVDDTVRLPPVLIQPMASGDVAEALAIAALRAPANGIVEVGGPERFRLDELIRTALIARGDTRGVLTDPTAPYWGLAVEQRTLVPADDATTLETRFADWILHAAATEGHAEASA